MLVIVESGIALHRAWSEPTGFQHRVWSRFLEDLRQVLVSSPSHPRRDHYICASSVVALVTLS